MSRPSFATTIRALEVAPTDEEADVADALRQIEADHQGGADLDPDADTWGICSHPNCAVPWPCPVWNEAEQDAVLFLGRAQDRAAAHARRTLDRLAYRREARAC